MKDIKILIIIINILYKLKFIIYFIQVGNYILGGWAVNNLLVDLPTIFLKLALLDTFLFLILLVKLFSRT